MRNVHGTLGPFPETFQVSSKANCGFDLIENNLLIYFDRKASLAKEKLLS